MRCSICGHPCTHSFRATVLGSIDVQYFHCSACGLLQTEPPHWLDRAYQEPINALDTGILTRNIELSRIVAVLIDHALNCDGLFLDYGGGCGLFGRLMRDLGYDFFWQDPLSQNLFCRGFEYHPGLVRPELITALEVFEHVPQPLEVFAHLLDLSDNVLFTTQLLPDPIPQPADWWYFGFEHGQHVSFFELRTLQKIADHFQVHLYSTKNVHFMTRCELPVLSRGRIHWAGRLARFPGIAGGIFRRFLPVDYATLVDAADLYFLKPRHVKLSRTHSDMLLLRTLIQGGSS